VVTLLENGEPVAVVLSPAEPDRLDEQDHIRREAKARARRTIASIHLQAAEHDRDGIDPSKSPQAVAPHFEICFCIEQFCTDSPGAVSPA
jgi:hypothetical protein